MGGRCSDQGTASGTKDFPPCNYVDVHISLSRIHGAGRLGYVCQYFEYLAL